MPTFRPFFSRPQEACALWQQRRNCILTPAGMDVESGNASMIHRQKFRSKSPYTASLENAIIYCNSRDLILVSDFVRSEYFVHQLYTWSLLQYCNVRCLVAGIISSVCGNQEPLRQPSKYQPQSSANCPQKWQAWNGRHRNQGKGIEYIYTQYKIE